MPNYALQFNGSGYVDITAKTAGSASTDVWTAIFDLEIPNTSQILYGRDATATIDYFRITGANTCQWRIGAGTVNTITISQNWPISTRFTLEIIRESGRNLVVKIDTVEVYRANAQPFGSAGDAISITSIGKNFYGTLSGLVYEATIQGSNYLNATSATESTWGDGTLTDIPNTNWVEYGGAVTPITFDGNIANQTFTAGDSVNLDLSGNWSGTQTPLTFALTSGLLTGTGLTLSSAGVLSGTATESAVAGLVITGTDADLNIAASNPFSITVNAAPTGSDITISDTLPALDSSLTMTYDAPASVGTITISDWANNTGTPLPNLTEVTVNVRSLVDGSLIYRTTTATTNAGSDCIVSDAAIVTGTDYEVSAIKFNGVDYDIGIAIITAT